jgi:hypothetical protein
MSGRVVDVAVNPENPTEFYVGYASGGLWYTNNNGMSFSAVMDTAPTKHRRYRSRLENGYYLGRNR